MAAEIIDNSMDETVAGFASRISVHLKAEDGSLTVGDNGRGIPTDPHPKFPDKSALEVILTTLACWRKISGKAYETSGGLHGVGVCGKCPVNGEMMLRWRVIKRFIVRKFFTRHCSRTGLKKWAQRPTGAAQKSPSPQIQRFLARDAVLRPQLYSR